MAKTAKLPRADRVARRKRMAERVEAGEDPGAIARELGVSFDLVRLACHENGIPWRKPKWGATLDVLARLWDQSKTLAAIGAECGVTESRASQIYTAAVAAGIPVPRRNRGGRKKASPAETAERGPLAEAPVCPEAGT